MGILALGFLKNALLASLLTSIVCGIVSSLVYSNRLTFMSGGIAHAAYGGIGLGIFLGWNVILTALGFTVLISLVMGYLTKDDRNKIDNVVGLIWAGGMAFGIILLDLAPGYHVDVMSYLFGSIIVVSNNNLLIMLILTLIICIIVALNYHKFLSISFDQDFASSRGLRVDGIYITMILLIAITVVMLVQVVGIILVIALMSIPPYLSSHSAKTMQSMMLFSFIWSFIFCVLGIMISYIFNISSGAAIIAVSVIFGSMFLGLRRIFA